MQVGLSGEGGSCIAGAYYEPSNAYAWSFTLQGASLNIVRFDRTCYGNLTQSADSWTGVLKCGSDFNVTLTPNTSCGEVTTNYDWLRFVRGVSNRPPGSVNTGSGSSSRFSQAPNTPRNLAEQSNAPAQARSQTGQPTTQTPAKNSAPDATPEWITNIEWSIRDTGPVNCPEQYSLVTDCRTEGRACVMRRAIQLARLQECGQAYDLTMVTQCHNPAAQKSIAAAGVDQVCQYLRQKYQSSEAK